MKIGILTYHWATNYGAVLQAYALKTTLEKNGIEANVVDFAPYELLKEYNYNPFGKGLNMKKRIINMFHYSDFKTKFFKYKEFNKKRLSLTDKISKVEELKEKTKDFDGFITGSDQVWNAPLCDGFLPVYLLDFVEDGKKRMSYAASFGGSKVDSKYNDIFKKNLNKISHLSVREEKGKEIVKNIADKEAEQVLDPVFLLSGEEWSNVAQTPKEKDDYIVLYMLEYNEELIRLAKQVAEKNKMKIINVLPKAFKNRAKKITDYNIYDGGPEDFIGYMKNAKYVFTNSFHGTAFSIVFNKPFITVPHSTTNSRMENILKLMGLESQQLKSTKDITELDESKLYYDTKKVMENLKREVSKSTEFIKRISAAGKDN